MSSSEQQKNENSGIFSDIKPIKVFEYPDQTSKIIWSVNSNNILQITSQIIELITTNKISVQMALYLIDIISQIRVKEIKLYSELYQKISNEFSCIIQPKNLNLAALFYKGLKFESFKAFMTEEEILNLFSTESPLYYIAWDKVNDLKNKFPNLDLEKKINDITPLDCAIKYGSELCFNYLKNLGAQYTDESEKYALQGGNKEIFMQMIDDGKLFKNMINTALDYRNYEIAEYLRSNFIQPFNSIAESMHFGNYDIVSHLLSNGWNINKIYKCYDSIDVNRFWWEECPLSIAINTNSIEIVQFLVEHGAYVNKKLGWGKKDGIGYNFKIDEISPLSIAIKIEATNIFNFLVEHGATIV